MHRKRVLAWRSAERPGSVEEDEVERSEPRDDPAGRPGCVETKVVIAIHRTGGHRRALRIRRRSGARRVRGLDRARSEVGHREECNKNWAIHGVLHCCERWSATDVPRRARNWNARTNARTLQAHVRTPLMRG